MIRKLSLIALLILSAVAFGAPDVEDDDNQYWEVSNCLDDNTASECLENYPEWADDPQLVEALKEQTGCGTDTECEAIDQ